MLLTSLPDFFSFSGQESISGGIYFGLKVGLSLSFGGKERKHQALWVQSSHL